MRFERLVNSRSPRQGKMMRTLWGICFVALVCNGPVAVAQERPERVNSIGVRYRFTSFSGSRTPWHETSFQFSKSTPLVSLIARLNHAYRFGKGGIQFEVDAYPKFGSGRYAYLNLGFSGDGLFPGSRFGAEFFQSLPGSFEASAGFRHLRFSSSKVTLYTASVGHYKGNYWFSLRPFLKFKSGNPTGSLGLSVRKYRSGRDDFTGFRLSVGSGLDELSTEQDLARLTTLKVAAEGRVPILNRWVVRWSAGIEWEELDSTRNRTRILFGFGLDGHL